MEKLNVYVYWVGDQERKKIIAEKFQNYFKNRNDINLIIGPTDEEQQYLINTFKFYKINIEKKKYAFASDFFRIWKISQLPGLYIDAMSLINEEKLDEFINLTKTTKNIFFRENGHICWNGIFYSSDTKLFKKILEFYTKFPKLASSLTGPLLLSTHIYQKYNVKKSPKEDVIFLDARDVDYYGDSYFKYNGMGSWGKNKTINFEKPELTGAHKYFHKNAIKFSNGGFSKSWAFVRWAMKNYYLFYYPYVKIKWAIKGKDYENSNN